MKDVLLIGSAVAIRTLAATLVVPVFSLYALGLTDSRFLVGLATGVSGLVQALLEIPLGAASDRIGRKRILIGGNLFFFMGAVLSATTRSIFVLILARMLQGVGTTASALLSFVADSTEKEKRGRALGFVNILFALSFLLGVVAGPALTRWVQLRGLFWIGAILSVVGTLLMLPASEGRRDPHPPLGAGNILGLLSNRPLLAVNLSALLANYVTGSMFFLLPLVVKSHLGVEDFWQFTLPMVASGVFALALLTKWIDKEKRGRLSAVSGLSLLAGVLLPLAATYPSLLAGYSLFFTGLALELTLLGALTTLLPPQENTGLKSGLFSVFQSSGIFLGGSLTGFFTRWGLNWGYLSLGVVVIGLGILKIGLAKLLNSRAGISDQAAMEKDRQPAVSL